MSTEVGVALNFKEEILCQLERQNRSYGKFNSLINSHTQLQEQNKELHKRNQALSDNAKRLKQLNEDLKSRAEAGSLTADRSEQYAALEKKLYRVQEELTEVHRTRGTRAQQIIDLNVALQEKEREILESNGKLQEKNSEIAAASEKTSELEQRVSELQLANQTVNDEYQALHLSSTTVEEKLRQLQVENQDLVERWLRYKHREANVLNSENDQFKSKVDEKVKAAIQDAIVGRKVQVESESAAAAAKASSIPPTFSLKQKFTDFFSSSRSTLAEETMHMRSSMPQSSIITQLPQEVTCKWKAHESDVTATRFSSSGGGILATGGSDKFVHIWNFVGDQNRLQHTLRGSNGGITNLDFDPQEQFIAASSSDYATRIWMLATQRLKLTLTGHGGKVLASRFVGSQHRLASGSNDRTVKVWDVRSGACTRTFMAGSSCNDLIAADGADCLVSGHFDRKIRVWDARSSRNVLNEVVVGGRVTSLDMPADLSLLLCCTKDHTLELIDLRKSQVLRVFSDDRFKVATDQTRCAFSPDGGHVAAGSSDGSVLCWRVHSGELECVDDKAHNDPVITCNWRSGRLVTGDKNKTCVLWTGGCELRNSPDLVS